LGNHFGWARRRLRKLGLVNCRFEDLIVNRIRHAHFHRDHVEHGLVMGIGGVSGELNRLGGFDFLQRSVRLREGCFGSQSLGIGRQGAGRGLSDFLRGFWFDRLGNRFQRRRGGRGDLCLIDWRRRLFIAQSRDTTRDRGECGFQPGFRLIG
jgi:hypothetical protein